MSKNRRCPTLAFESEPGFNHTMFPQMASPHGSNLTCSAPLSRNQVPKTSSARLGLAASRNAVKARQRRTRFITFSLRYCFRLTDIRQMHVAQGCREAACDEVRYRCVQLLVLGGIAGAGRETFVNRSAGACKPDHSHIVQWWRGHLFDDVERLSVEDPDFVQRMDLIVGFQHRAVSEETYAFDLSATAAEIRFCFGDDDVGVEPLRGHLGLNELLEWIATNDVDRSNDGILLDSRKCVSLVSDRLHLKASVQCRGCLLDDQVVEAPGPDREALAAVVQPGQPACCEGYFVAHRRDDADSLDRLQFR